MNKFKKIFSIILFSVFVISCNNSNDDSTSTGGTSPDQPTDEALWSEIKTHHRSDMVVEGQCPFPWILTINHEGRFRGHCDERLISGTLTDDELAELTRRANAVAEDIQIRNCDDIAPIVETYHTLFVEGVGARRFYDIDIESGQICLRGGVEDAENLADYLVNTILVKYFHP